VTFPIIVFTTRVFYFSSRARREASLLSLAMAREVQARATAIGASLAACLYVRDYYLHDTRDTLGTALDIVGGEYGSVRFFSEQFAMPFGTERSRYCEFMLDLGHCFAGFVADAIGYEVKPEVKAHSVLDFELAGEDADAEEYPNLDLPPARMYVNLRDLDKKMGLNNCGKIVFNWPTYPIPSSFFSSCNAPQARRRGEYCAASQRKFHFHSSHPYTFHLDIDDVNPVLIEAAKYIAIADSSTRSRGGASSSSSSLAPSASSQQALSQQRERDDLLEGTRFAMEKLLEVESMPSLLDVKRAYRRLLLQWHPDKYRGDKSDSFLRGVATALLEKRYLLGH
jgi:hypothetical protein